MSCSIVVGLSPGGWRRLGPCSTPLCAWDVVHAVGHEAAFCRENVVNAVALAEWMESAFLEGAVWDEGWIGIVVGLSEVSNQFFLSVCL